jgi:1,4-dihydroxy-2-naphthoate octaprenyltransferase
MNDSTTPRAGEHRATSRVRAWIQASRPLAQVNIALPLLFGELIAFVECARLDLGLLVLAHLFGIFDQLFIVYANDLADEEGDRLHTSPSAFSGGSRVLPEGKLDRRALGRGAIVAALAGLAVMIVAAVAMDRPAAPLFWGVAVMLLWAYSYPPLRLSYRGAGELAQGIGVGVVLPLLGFYLQAGTLGGFPWPALAPSFMLAVASNIATALPDTKADEAVDKLTWPVRFGEVRARKHALQLVALGALATPFVVPDLPHAGLAMVEAGPLLLLAVAGITIRRSGDTFTPAATSRLVLLTGAAINLTLVGWVVALAMRPPWGW